MNKKFLFLCATFLYLLSFNNSIHAQCLSGTYQIGGSNPSANSFSSLVYALENFGVCGSVTVEVFPGTYNEQLDIDNISGASATNFIKFVSATTNITDVNLSIPSANVGDNVPNYVIRLNGADYITFEGMTIERTGNATEANVIVLENNATHNAFDRNKIETRTVSPSQSQTVYPIYIEGNSNNDYNQFKNNAIHAGAFSIHALASSTNPIQDLQIINNQFYNPSRSLVYGSYINNLQIEENDMYRTTGAIEGVIDLRHCDINLNIQNNLINASIGKGIWLQECHGTSSQPLLIANNFISMSYSNCIQTDTISYVNIYHNSIYSRLGSSSSAIKMNDANHVNVKNNNTKSVGISFIFDNVAASCDVNHNNLYAINGGFSLYWNGSFYSNLLNWQAASSFDFNSVSIAPSFFSDSDLRINNQQNFDDLGTPVGILTDFDGELRDLATPDIGADEYTYALIQGDDIRLAGYYNQQYYVCEEPQDLYMIVENTSNGVIDSFTLNWYRNDILQTPSHWTGTLLPNEKDTVFVGTYLPLGLGADTLKTTVFTVNGQPDLVTNNNLFIRKSKTGLPAGTYTIGINDSDFSSFEEVEEIINGRGICGEIDFIVRAGEYKVQIDLYNVSGVSDSSWISFSSESDNPEVVKILPVPYDYFSGDPVEPLFKMTLTDYVRFDRMTFVGGDGVSSLVGAIAGNHIEVRNCIFYSDGFATSNLVNNGRSNIGLSGTCLYHVYENNTFHGGRGFSMSSGLFDEVIIKNNQFLYSNYGFIHVRGLNNALIEDNYFQSTTPSSGLTSSWFNIQGSSNTINSLIFRGNRFEFQEKNGMFLVNKNGIEFTNNTFYGEGNLSHLVHFSDCKNLEFHFNTMMLNSSNTNSTSIYTVNFNILSNSNSSISNNSFNNIGLGHAVKMDYYNNSVYNFTSNYNHFHAASGQPFKTYNTLASWQTTNNQDTNSVLGVPSFISNKILFAQNDTALIQKGNRQISPSILVNTDVDIHGESRGLITDIGADEFSTITSDIGLVYVNKPETCHGTPNVKVRFKNYGTDTVRWAYINWEVDGELQEPYFWQGALSPNDTTDVFEIGQYLFDYSGNTLKLWTSNSTDISSVNDSLNVPFFQNQMGGTYYIGTIDADFYSFPEAIIALDSAGLCSPIQFMIHPRTYYDGIDLPAIDGNSSTNTIRFEAIEDSSSTFLSISPKITSTDYVAIKGVTVGGIGSVESLSVRLYGNVDDFTIENCRLYGKMISNTSQDNNTTIRNNHFYGECLSLGGTSPTVLDSNIVIEGNTFEGVLLSGPNAWDALGFSYVDSLYFRNNTVLADWIDGVSLSQCVGDIQITGNTMVSWHEAIDITNCNGSTANPILIANNFLVSAYTPFPYNNHFSGINISNSSYVDVYHNTLFEEYNMEMKGITSNGGSQIKVENNLIGYRNFGYALDLDISGVVSSDYNVCFAETSDTAEIFYRSSGSHFYYQVDLQTWRSEYNRDLHTRVYTYDQIRLLASEPTFPDRSDLHLSPNMAIPLLVSNYLSNVSNDIDGETRDLITPKVGADEYTVATNNAQILAISPQLISNCAGQFPVSISIKNYGTVDLTSLNIHWSVNDSIQPIFNWTGNIPFGDSALINIGNYNFTEDVTIRAWSSLPNNQIDEFSFFDTIQRTMPISLNGAYTIGTNNGDFDSFTSAVNALISKGICGPVTFNVQAGTYEEQISIPAITGTSIINTITFQSENLDSSNVILTSNHSNFNSSSDYTIRLSAAENIRFQHMTLEASFEYYARVIDIEGGAKNIVLNDLSIKSSPKENNSSEDNAIVTIYPTSSANIDSIQFFNNRVVAGLKGLDIGYNSHYSTGIEIRNNYFYGQPEETLKLRSAASPIIADNYFGGAGAGINIEVCIDSFQFLRNRVIGKLLPAVSFSAINGVNARGLIANNVVYDNHLNSNNTCFRMNGGTNYDFYNNTIVNVSPSTYSNTFEATSGTNARFYNNIFAGNGGEVIDFSNMVNVVADYNLLYNTGSNIGKFNGTVYTILSTWQTGTGLDANSISVDPIFPTNTDERTLLNPAAMNLGIHLPQVLTDIDGNIKNTSTPDMGAYEVDAFDYNMSIESMTPDTEILFGTNNIAAKFRNLGVLPVDSFKVAWSINDTLQSIVAQTTSLNQGVFTGTIPIGNYNFGYGEYTIKVWVFDPNGMTDQDNNNDTLSLTYTVEGMIGTYYIGLAGDFYTINQAIDSMIQKTIIGPVTMRIQDGFYYENVNIPEISGMSAANPITFISDSEDTAAVSIYNNPQATPITNSMVTLDGARFVKFEHLKFNSTLLHAFYLKQDAQNITFENNSIEGPNMYNQSGSSGGSLIYANSGLGSTGDTIRDIAFNSNYFLNHNRAYNSATFTKVRQISFTNNHFNRQRITALEFDDDINLLISNNLFNSSGLTLSSVGGYIKINKNRFDLIDQNKPNALAYLLHVVASGTATQPVEITNNFIGYDDKTLVLGYGLQVHNSQYVNIYHNTFYVGGNSTQNRYCLNLTSSDNCNVMNNIFFNNDSTATNNGYLIRMSSINNCTFDYNVFYSITGNVGYSNSLLTSLSAFQTTVGGCNNCQFINPKLVSKYNLHLQSNSPARDAAVYLPNVTDDIDGDIRTTTNRDIGADEYQPFTYDALVASIDSPTTQPVFVLQNHVYATIRNDGLQNLTSVDVHWSINDTLQQVFNWAGNLGTGMSSNSLFLGNYTFAGAIYNIKVWTTLPNGVTDQNNLNDTLNFVFSYPPLGGNYPIGSTTGMFTSPQQAICYLKWVGMSSPVIADIEPGVYNQQLHIPAIAGSSPTNTLTIQSSTQNANDVTFQYSALDSTNNYVICMDSLQYINVNHLTIEALGNDFAKVIDLRGNSSNINFSNNILRSKDILRSSTEDFAIVLLGGAHSNISFDNNRFEDGHLGLLKTNNLIAYDLTIKNNTFNDQLLGNIHLETTNGTVIQKNRMMTISTNDNFKSIFLSDAKNQFDILQNTFDLNDGIGINIINSQINSSNFGLVANNMIALNSTSTATGIDFDNISQVNLLHNSINIYGLATNTDALKLNQYANGNILNNIFSNAADGYAVNVVDAFLFNSTMDYNDLYSTGQYFGYWNGAFDDLQVWPSFTNSDQNSLSIFPNFISETDLHIDINNPVLNNVGTPTGTITFDIDDDTRSNTTPDIGADEYIYTSTQQWSVIDNTIKVFPNPSHGYFSMAFDEPINENYTISVFSIDGRLIEARVSSNQSEAFNIQEKGQYLIQIKMNKSVTYMKLLVQ